MPVSTSERNRILHLVESGQVTATEAAQLLDTLEIEQEQRKPDEQSRSRTIRVQVTNVPTNRRRVNMSATIPVSLIKVSLRLGSRLIPQLQDSALEDLLRAIEGGAKGRLLDLQDMEEGERVEIFAE